MTRAHRVAINLPQPLHDYVKKLADRRGIPVTAAFVAIIGEYMDSAAKGARPKPKKGK